MIDRQPPSALDIERTVLGSALTDTSSARVVLELLDENSFYSSPNQKVFLCLKEMTDGGVPVDILTLIEALRKKQWIEGVGGESYVVELTESIVTAANIKHYAKILLDLAARRRAIISLTILKNNLFEADNDLVGLTNSADLLATQLQEATEIITGEESDTAKIVSPEMIKDRMEEYRQNGLQNDGIDPGWVTLAEHYRPARGTLNIITGIPSHGKSEFVDALMVNTAQSAKWKWMVFSPENWPLELHIQKIADKFLGVNLRREATAEQLSTTITWANQHFGFVQLSEENHTLSALLHLIIKQAKNHEFDALLIDPWNELDANLEEDERETEYISRSLSRLRRFGRKNNVAVFIVAHPAKMYKPHGQETYDVPTLYNISGSAAWYNKADNGLCIYRPDVQKDEIDVHVQKIKFKIHGNPGMVTLFYDKNNGRFYEKERTGWEP